MVKHAKQYALLFAALLLAASVTAANVDESRARKAAELFWLNAGGKGVLHLNTQSAQFQHLYFFTSDQVGYVVVAGDDCAHPILGYSLDASASSAMPAALRGWLSDYDRHIAAAIKAGAPSCEEWNAATKGGYATKAVVVDPLITATWRQSTYYNALCPTNTLVGCVALAMGEVMRYWHYPEHGTSSYSYTYSGITHSVDFEQTYYDWGAMPNALSSNNEAVATLLYHCGVAIETEYGSSVSSAFVLSSASHQHSAEHALKTYFGYDSHLGGARRDTMTTERWEALLRSELDAHRPIIYNGFNQNYSGGHCFICDGYRDDGYFHFNWGQGGSYDGYFVSNALTPMPSVSFSYDQGGLFGVQPQQVEPSEGIDALERVRIAAYPNPTMSTVTLSGVEFGTEVRVINALGTVVLNTLYDGSPLDISWLPVGIYLLRTPSMSVKVAKY